MGKNTRVSGGTPDPAIGQAALMDAQTGQEWLKFAKDSFEVSKDRQAEIDALTKRVTEQQLGQAEDAASWSRQDRARYESLYQPVEDQFVKEASQRGTPEAQAAAAAKAKTDVATEAALQRGAAERSSWAVGVNPASGRFAGIGRAGELGTALGEAGAANAAREAERDKGLALKADVTNIGRGLPAQSATAAGIGLSGGSAAVGNTLSANQAYLASLGIMNQGYAGQMQGYANQASILNQQYRTQADVGIAQKQLQLGYYDSTMQAIAGVAGAALGASSKRVKTDKKKLPEGAGLKAVKAMPVEEWRYKPGVADEGRHIGAYAEDFKKATGKGDGKSIPFIDAIGVTMKAVQELAAKTERLEKAIGTRRAA